MAKTRFKKNTESSAHQEASYHQNNGQEHNSYQEQAQGGLGEKVPKLTPEQLFQVLAANVSSFETVLNHIKEKEKQPFGHNSKASIRIEEIESSKGSSDDRHPRRKKHRRSPSQVPINVSESSHKQYGYEPPYMSGIPVREELNRILHHELDMNKYTAFPFTSDIENYPLPLKFKIPTMKSYDATTDPDDHLFAFLT